MISKPTIQLDERDAAQIVRELLARRAGYVPEWQPVEKGAEAALVRVFARYLQAIIQRLNQSPQKNKLAFLDLLGLSLVPAQAARAPIVFQLAAGGPDSQSPASTQVAAPPPPGSTNQIVFETEEATGIAAAQLKEVVSLWPGRDQYLNHSTAFLAGQSFQLFRKPLLEDTPHAIYVAHNTLLALAGQVNLEVEFELTQPGTEPLAILWQYWDGKVWRGFKSVRAACSEKEFANADSTGGLTRSGRFLLETDCAQSSQTSVNGIEAFWIRGQLTETLPPDPAQSLPLVESIRLSTIVRQSLKGTLQPLIKRDLPIQRGGASSTSKIHGKVINEAGQALDGLTVKVTSPDDPNFQQALYQTDAGGQYNSSNSPSEIASHDRYKIEVSFLELEASTVLRGLDENRDLEVDLTFNVAGLDPDNAFADGTKLDVTKPFYPLGQQPLPGSTFYFSQEEVFSKPGAKVQIYMARTTSPQDLVEAPKTSQQIDVPDSESALAQAQNESRLEHLLAWEYWDGRKWITKFQSSLSPKPTGDLNTTEIIEFDVPRDMVKTTINDQEAYWMRVRLVSGGFGFIQKILFFDQRLDDVDKTNEITYIVPQPPSLAAFRIGYTWRYGPFHPEQVQTYNDFQYEDRTYEAIWPGNAFLPFKFVRDVTPALYLGFDKKLPVDRLGLYFDIVEQKGETSGPAMVWEYFDGSEWRTLVVEDETRNLRLPGIFSFIGAADSQPLARFGSQLHWLRGRLKEDSPPIEPTVNGIFINAVWASQRRTLVNIALGTSSGLPNQVFAFTDIPVLPGERIEVQELSGARANVEWRIIAMEIAGNDPNIVRDLEEMLGREGSQVEVTKGDLRLVRDRNKKVAEVWVRWYERPNLFGSGLEDRHYVIDRARGLVFFGDGEHGKIPSAGALVQCAQYSAGGGLVGNVAARAISQMLAPIPGAQAVFNPSPAEGGADGETIESFGLRAPQSVSHRGRAIRPADYETLAHEATPGVAVARAIAERDASGRSLPGRLTLLIIPQNEDPRPWPSFGLREQVRKFLEARAPADLAAASQIYITGPDYLPVDVTATLSPADISQAGPVERRARAALQQFLHPLRGGPDKRGWELGRDLYLSDVAAVLERVEGVDYVKELSLLIDGELQGERIAVADDRIVVAGKIQLKLRTAEA